MNSPTHYFAHLDPDKAEALNEIPDVVYRTALKLHSLQKRCHLHLIDVSLIKRILAPCQAKMQEDGSVSVKDLSVALQRLFHCASKEKLSPVEPKAVQLTLNLLTATYDRTGTGFIHLRSVAAALIALSVDSLSAKYRGLFQLLIQYGDNQFAPGNQVTRSILRILLNDLIKIPAAVSENNKFGDVENTVKTCFKGVSNPGINEEQFMMWLQSEPPLLLWIPTLYRISATEAVVHPVKCSICKIFPITGLRYSCLKCLNCNLCQVCFLIGKESKHHKQSHPMEEHYKSQTSLKENVKHFARIVRNNLLRERCKRKEFLRRALIVMQSGNASSGNQELITGEGLEHQENAEMMNAAPANTGHQEEQEMPNSTIVNSGLQHQPDVYAADVLVAQHVSGKMKQKATEQHHGNSALQQQKPKQSRNRDLIRKLELHDMQAAIRILQKENRYLEKKFERWKVNTQCQHCPQEKECCKLEAKIDSLVEQNLKLQTELMQLQQILQTKQESDSVGHPLTTNCHNLMPVYTGPLLPSSHQDTCTESGQQCLSNKSGQDIPIMAQLHVTSSSPEDNPEVVAQSSALKGPKEIGLRSDVIHQHPITMPPNSSRRSTESNNDAVQPLLWTDSFTDVALTGDLLITAEVNEDGIINAEEKNSTIACDEEEKLFHHIQKLKDALSFKVQAGPSSALKQDLLSVASHLEKSFSHLVNQVASQ
ncbi:dystrotelin isoform X3 [Protopterus annectens]|uniref:dystrotelin isoform X3 n=1 Tax=Protopterus annectens TaxID=7888 RepID=UPI001CFACBCB|nr:dystrotelin isoform X3 [Protopterus annectens]